MTVGVTPVTMRSEPPFWTSVLRPALSARLGRRTGAVEVRMGRTQSAPSPDTGVSNLALLRTAATAHAKFVLASRGSCLKLDGHSGRRQERGELPRRAGREATSCAAKDRRGQDGAWTGAADSGRCRADPPCGAAARRDGLCACARARALCGAPRAGARSVARGCARPAAGGSNSRPRYHAPGASPRSSPVAVTAAFFWGGLTPPRGLRAARCEPRRLRDPPAPPGCMRTLWCTSGTSPFHLPGVP